MLPPPPSSPLFPYTTLFRSPGSTRPRLREPSSCARSSRSAETSDDEHRNERRGREKQGDRRVILRHDERAQDDGRSEEHTSELQSHVNLVCRLLLEKKKK